MIRQAHRIATAGRRRRARSRYDPQGAPNRDGEAAADGGVGLGALGAGWP
jgi:hypothetical protein